MQSWHVPPGIFLCSLRPAHSLFREAGLFRFFSLPASNAQAIRSQISSNADQASGNPYVAQALDYIKAKYKISPKNYRLYRQKPGAAGGKTMNSDEATPA